MAATHRSTPRTVGPSANAAYARRVAKFLNCLMKNSPLEWEMYIQPHLNGLRPDLVLLNPTVGIAVFEIKDWSLTTIQNIIEANRTTQNPFNQIKRYKEEILELYCPRLNDSFGHAAKQAITAGLIFTRIPQAEINRYCPVITE